MCHPGRELPHAGRLRFCGRISFAGDWSLVRGTASAGPDVSSGRCGGSERDGVELKRHLWDEFQGPACRGRTVQYRQWEWKCVEGGMDTGASIFSWLPESN